MIKGKTSTGFKFEIDESIKDSFEFLRCIRRANDSSDADSQVAGSYDLVAMILGGESGVDKLLDHIRKTASVRYVPIEMVTAEIKDMIEAMNVKN